MTERIKNIANQNSFTIYHSPIWHIKVEQYSKAIAQDCIDQLADLKGYSGVGEDGDPYDTSSWNAALTAAAKLLILRFNLENKDEK